MTPESVLRLTHIIGAAVLFGTGAGIAFFMLMAHRTGNAVIIAAVARIVVIADFLFTATAIVLQPATGLLLVYVSGWPLSEGWIVLSIGLYLFAGLFWIPVVFMQIRMRDYADEAVRLSRPLPAEYQLLYRRWFRFGFPAFGAVLAIYWLMITKPAILLPGL